MFLIKQVSSDLGITPQAIYKQKEELQNKGYMIKNSSFFFTIVHEKNEEIFFHIIHVRFNH